jgi:hypothetical protein
MRRPTHPIIDALAALALGTAAGACGPVVTEQPGDDDTGTTGGTEDGEVGEGEPGPGPGEAGETPFLGLPPASAFGMRFDPDAAANQPRILRIDAPRLHAIDPSIEAIEITHDLDPLAQGGFFDVSITVRAVGASCEPDASPLLAFDTAEPEAALWVAPELRQALLGDLQDQAHTGQCAAVPVPGPGGPLPPGGPVPGPGGPNWWGFTPCAADQDALGIQDTIVLVTEGGLMLSFPSWNGLCGTIPEPTQVTYCEGLVSAMEDDVLAAIARRMAARQMIGAQMSLAYDAVDIAAENALGAAVLGNFNPAIVAELAQLAVWVSGLRWAIENQTAIAYGNLSHARILANFEPVVLEPAALELTAALAVYDAWNNAAHEVSGCYDRVTRWIAVGAAIGFGIRFWFPPGANVAEGGKASDSDSSLVIELSSPQAMAQHWANPIELDLDTMPSYISAGTRQDSGGKVSRTILAGYELPPGVTLPADILVPEPLTLIPIVAAPAGAPLVLDETQLEDGVPRVRYEYGALRFQGAYLDLQWENVDASGVSLDGLWAKCKVVPPFTPPPTPWFPHCDLGMETWASPEDISAGRLFSRYWHVASTGGIIDPRTGDVVETTSGFFVGLHKTAERPSNPCYVWDYEDEVYAWDPMLPGCGPVGGDDGGVEDGGDGGDGGGDDGPPPPPFP